MYFMYIEGLRPAWVKIIVGIMNRSSHINVVLGFAGNTTACRCDIRRGLGRTVLFGSVHVCRRSHTAA